MVLSPNVVTYAILINGYIKTKDVNKAMDLFREMCQKGFILDMVIYNSLIDGLCKSVKISCVKDLIHEMHGSGYYSDIITHSILLDTSFKMKHLNTAIV